MRDRLISSRFFDLVSGADPASHDPRARVSRSGGGKHTLRLQGGFPAGWCGRLSLGLSAAGVSIVRGFARRIGDSDWVAELQVLAEDAAADPASLDLLALATAPPPAGPPRRSRSRATTSTDRPRAAPTSSWRHGVPIASGSWAASWNGWPPCRSSPTRCRSRPGTAMRSTASICAPSGRGDGCAPRRRPGSCRRCSTACARPSARWPEAQDAAVGYSLRFASAESSTGASGSAFFSASISGSPGPSGSRTCPRATTERRTPIAISKPL